MGSMRRSAKTMRTVKKRFMKYAGTSESDLALWKQSMTADWNVFGSHACGSRRRWWSCFAFADHCFTIIHIFGWTIRKQNLYDPLC